MRTHAQVIAVLLVVVALLAGCAVQMAHYNMRLRQVERPAQAQERYGEPRITTQKEEGAEKYYFEDEMIKIAWLPTTFTMSFVLVNKTDHSIKIVWDEAAYVDENGASHRVMHSGVKYSEREKLQAPSIVVRKGRIEDSVAPTDNVRLFIPLGIVKYSEWEKDPLFPLAGDTRYIGKSVQVLVPLQIEGVVNEYIFVFEITDIVQVEAGRACLP